MKKKHTKRILYVTTISVTMSFFTEHFKMLINEGCSIELACNTSSKVINETVSLGLKIHNIPFSRNPLSKDNYKAYKQLKKIIQNGNYDIVHCHTPIASALTRIACKKQRKQGLKVFYTAHGFHFYKGAPLKNWLLFYPVEKWLSRYTDVLITINKEDYNLAKNKFKKCNKVEYIPGVGLNISKIEKVKINKNQKRLELNAKNTDFIITSVGEINTNKNHEVVIKAISRLNISNIHYYIAGEGNKRDYLIRLSKQLNIKNQIHLLGYRNDIIEIYKASDVCCFPSIREGLGMAALEGMACGLPVIASKNRGTLDYCNKDNSILCKYNSVDDFANAIVKLYKDKSLCKKMVNENKKIVELFSTENAVNAIKKIYFNNN